MSRWSLSFHTLKHLLFACRPYRRLLLLLLSSGVLLPKLLCFPSLAVLCFLPQRRFFGCRITLPF